ncbi:hypothetical protein Lalb_Chr10g0094291 [Lupinus albus]|uniref:Uncharacterized protein n=1 Tax=Lupinus albus TaxID=3870 RepID=A0A6A4PUH8_LUPAL|nr:hypothetical protein Lalb_Chr10g0094291 [Lupinus albus]
MHRANYFESNSLQIVLTVRSNIIEEKERMGGLKIRDKGRVQEI